MLCIYCRYALYSSISELILAKISIWHVYTMYIHVHVHVHVHTHACIGSTILYLVHVSCYSYVAYFPPPPPSPHTRPQRHVVSLRSGSSRNLPSSRPGQVARVSRSFIGSTPGEYITFLLRAHAREDRECLPVLDLYGWVEQIQCCTVCNVCVPSPDLMLFLRFLTLYSHKYWRN